MTPLSPDVANVFRTQGTHCFDLGSPFMARLMGLMADRLDADTSVGARVAAWPGDIGPRGASLPLRLAGALHALVLTGDTLAAAYPPHPSDENTLWRAVSSALTRRESDVLRWLESPPQTNEVRRAAALIAAAHWLAARHPGLPLSLLELGASAGLNLMFDHFALDAGGVRRGARDAALALVPVWHGPPPPETTFSVATRRGVDLRPLDPATDDGALRLRAYLWADQPHRRTLTDAAIAVAAAPVDRGDAGEWLAARSLPVPGRISLVFHTIAWQYFPPATQACAEAALAEAGARATAEAPLARLAMEADSDHPGAALTLTLWPGGETHRLARVDFHGRWLDWRAPDPI